MRRTTSAPADLRAGLRGRRHRPGARGNDGAREPGIARALSRRRALRALLSPRRLFQEQHRRDRALWRRRRGGVALVRAATARASSAAASLPGPIRSTSWAGTSPTTGSKRSSRATSPSSSPRKLHEVATSLFCEEHALTLARHRPLRLPSRRREGARRARGRVRTRPGALARRARGFARLRQHVGGDGDVRPRADARVAGARGGARCSARWAPALPPASRCSKTGERSLRSCSALVALQRVASCSTRRATRAGCSRAAASKSAPCSIRSSCCCTPRGSRAWRC